jgi:hypothetical protein
MEKQQKIVEMAKDICRVKLNCNDVCNPVSACDALKYAERAVEAGYSKIPDNIGDFSDGYHTFNELYHHRAVLFSVICNMFPEKAWKSKLHDTGDMFEGMFIVGIVTEQGQATYHYDIEPYWDMFNVKELEKAPKWDGHTPSDAIGRIGNISVEGYRKQSEGEWEEVMQGYANCSVCGAIFEALPTMYAFKQNNKFCRHCGAKMKGGDTDA